MVWSYCPFFIENKPVAVSRKDAIFAEAKVNLSGLYLLLVFPDIHISTAAAYREMKPKSPDFRLAEVVNRVNIGEWKGKLTNDFEDFAFKHYPELQKAKNAGYEHFSGKLSA